MFNKMNILITGGAGYIGSHAAIELIDRGHNVTIIDNLSTGHKELIPKQAKFINCNINDVKVVRDIVTNERFDALMHFAAFVQVEESVNFPDKYFENNTSNSTILFNTCIENGLNNIIFSSTAATYGNSKKETINEETSLSPINPYGESKLKTEKNLIYLSKTKNAYYVILRYFNVAGADSRLRSGLISKKTTHLIKIASEAAVGIRDSVTIFGNDYDTHDGTAIRDFIHVSDVADIHIKSLEYLLENKKSIIMNCGYGRGYSVKEVLDAINKITDGKVKIKYGPRRIGDVQSLIANVNKLMKKIEWRPKYNNMEFILKTAIEWEKKFNFDAIKK